MLWLREGDVDVVVCYGWGGRVTTNLEEWMWCHCRVRHGSVLRLGKEGDQLWRSTWCHGKVPL